MRDKSLRVAGTKEQAVRRASARQKTKEREALFAKYCDKDQLLSQVEAFALCECV